MYRYNSRITKKDLDRFSYNNNNQKSLNQLEEFDDDLLDDDLYEDDLYDDDLLDDDLLNDDLLKERQTPPKCEKVCDFGIAELVTVIGLLSGALKVTAVLVAIDKTYQVFLDGSLDPKREEDAQTAVQDLLQFVAGRVPEI